jgi:hypothetical protein
MSSTGIEMERPAPYQTLTPIFEMSEKIFTQIFHSSSTCIRMHRPRPPVARACTKFSLVVVRHLGFQVCVAAERGVLEGTCEGDLQYQAS